MQAFEHQRTEERSCGRRWFLATWLLAASALACSCASNKPDTTHRIIISVDEQQMLVLRDNQPVEEYPVSTSRFGLGDRPGSNCTPLGKMRVEDKIGDRAVAGTVFRGRRPTGEVLRADAPGRDPIVTRIIWLRGLESQNRNAYGRYIYIHGTPEERKIGQPASFGCIRMRSKDIIDLYKMVGEGASVEVVRGHLPHHRASFGRWSSRAPRENLEQTSPYRNLVQDESSSPSPNTLNSSSPSPRSPSPEQISAAAQAFNEAVLGSQAS